MTSSVTKDNGAPRDLTPAVKVARIAALLERTDLTAQQKCVATKLFVEATRKGVAEVSTVQFLTACSAKDRETVFRATRKLRDLGLIEKSSSKGRLGCYNILPEHVIAAVENAYNQKKTGRVEPDQLADTPSGETGRDDSTRPVGSDLTSRVEPVGLNRTGRVEPDQLSPHGARAYKEYPTGINNNINNTPPLTPPQPEIPLREGEELLAHGVIINCETIRHVSGAFSISIPAIECRMVMDIPRDQVMQKAKGFALQWGLEIENGNKRAIPDSPLSMICASLTADKTRSDVAYIKKAKAQGAKTESNADRYLRIARENS